MVIGANSKDSIADVIRIGIRDVTRLLGHPEKLHYTTRGCDIVVTTNDITRGVDCIKISFSLRSPNQSELLLKVLRESGMGDQVEMYNGTCSLTVPPFDWRTPQKLAPLDDVFRRFGAEDLTSQSWKVRPVLRHCLFPRWMRIDTSITRPWKPK